MLLPSLKRLIIIITKPSNLTLSDNIYSIVVLCNQEEIKWRKLLVTIRKPSKEITHSLSLSTSIKLNLIWESLSEELVTSKGLSTILKKLLKWEMIDHQLTTILVYHTLKLASSMMHWRCSQCHPSSGGRGNRGWRWQHLASARWRT